MHLHSALFCHKKMNIKGVVSGPAAAAKIGLCQNMALRDVGMVHLLLDSTALSNAPKLSFFFSVDFG